jgi:ABC-type nitrate/sulfonate/bicarbonate transport system ATPase subunit
MTGRRPVLELRGVTKRYSGNDGDVDAVAAVDLVAAEGEFVSLIGPSGCGKSSLFNIVAGLQGATSGRVLINGEELGDRLGASSYMPQHDALLDWRRVIDNVGLSLELQGVSRREARRRARPQLERFGLGQFTRAWPWQLSGGMRQRVAFLRTVIADRSLLLLDEPFGSLDGITRADLQQWLSQVWAEVGSTVLLVTHDITEAVLLSDRIYVMSPRPGRITATIDVDLPRPRTALLKDEPAFVAIEQQLRRQLNAAILSWGEFSTSPR